jgi:cupin superfamily acireductone dioxygenase involved in methionine salvage
LVQPTVWREWQRFAGEVFFWLMEGSLALDIQSADGVVTSVPMAGGDIFNLPRGFQYRGEVRARCGVVCCPSCACV